MGLFFALFVGIASVLIFILVLLADEMSTTGIMSYNPAWWLIGVPVAMLIGWTHWHPIAW